MDNGRRTDNGRNVKIELEFWKQNSQKQQNQKNYQKLPKSLLSFLLSLILIDIYITGEYNIIQQLSVSPNSSITLGCRRARTCHAKLLRNGNIWGADVLFENICHGSARNKKWKISQQPIKIKKKWKCRKFSHRGATCCYARVSLAWAFTILSLFITIWCPICHKEAVTMSQWCPLCHHNIHICINIYSLAQNPADSRGLK